MNIEQANTVPISLLLDNLNIKAARKSGNDYYYRSPIRDEKTASFHVNTDKNVWFDHGIGEGGDCVKFAQKRLGFLKKGDTVSDALRWIGNMSGHGRIIIPATVQQQPEPDPEKTLSISKIQAIQDNGLIAYLDSRKIPLLLARRYLKELYIYNRNSKKRFIALGFENEDGGYEVRNRYFKGCIGSKTISFIRGRIIKPDGIHVFEGWPDFLSAVADQRDGQFDDDVIVLNSLSILDHATPYIKGYGYRRAYTWLDNDTAGVEAQKSLAEFFKNEEYLHHIAMNDRYSPYKDVNEWRTLRPS